VYADLPTGLPSGWEQDAAALGELAEDLLTAGVATRVRHSWLPAD